MLGNLTWWAVVLAGGALIVVATLAPRRLLPGSPRQARASRVILAAVVLVVVLVALCVLVRLRAYDRLDAGVVGELALARSPGLVAIFTVVTTIGDVVPSLLLATVVGIALFARERRLDVALILPVAMAVQLLLQELLGHLAGVDIAEVRPALALGGAGPIPSGSIARLYVVFVLGAVLWTRHSARTAAGFLLAGQALLLIELTSRLYLGRHFLVDIVGGLLLGVLLLLGGSWLLAGIDSARSNRPAAAADRPRGVSGRA